MALFKRFTWSNAVRPSNKSVEFPLLKLMACRGTTLYTWNHLEGDWKGLMNANHNPRATRWVMALLRDLNQTRRVTLTPVTSKQTWTSPLIRIDLRIRWNLQIAMRFVWINSRNSWLTAITNGMVFSPRTIRSCSTFGRIMSPWSIENAERNCSWPLTNNSRSKQRPSQIPFPRTAGLETSKQGRTIRTLRWRSSGGASRWTSPTPCRRTSKKRTIRTCRHKLKWRCRWKRRGASGIANMKNASSAKS